MRVGEGRRERGFEGGGEDGKMGKWDGYGIMAKDEGNLENGVGMDWMAFGIGVGLCTSQPTTPGTTKVEIWRSGC